MSVLKPIHAGTSKFSWQAEKEVESSTTGHGTDSFEVQELKHARLTPKIASGIWYSRKTRERNFLIKGKKGGGSHDHWAREYQKFRSQQSVVSQLPISPQLSICIHVSTITMDQCQELGPREQFPSSTLLHSPF